MTQILALLAFVFIIFLASILGTVVGAMSGWFVSLTPFGDWIKHVLGQPDYTLAQLGALLGFAGAFCRSSLTQPRKN